MNLSNYQLETIANKNNITLQEIIYQDEIFNLSKVKNMNIILNLQNSKSSGNGTHWVTLLKRDNNFFYFDSFGSQPPNIIKRYCKVNLGYNSYICQNLNTEVCGYYCIALIHYIDNHKGDLYDIANEFINIFESNTKFNKDILFKYIKQFMKK